MRSKQSKATDKLPAIVSGWLKSCRRNGKISRNTVAVGFVVLDRLRKKCPLTKGDAFSGGGELKGARSGLGKVLQRYGIPGTYLKEATTRQASHDAERLLKNINFGKSLKSLKSKERDSTIMAAISILQKEANKWLQRQNLKINCDRQSSPTAWVQAILKEAKGKSGGKVEQHLVGAKLQERHPKKKVANHPGHAGDAQTKRLGDFEIDSIVYHVTGTPGKEVVKKCRENATQNFHPVLVVPRQQVARAEFLVEQEGVGERVTILALEDFVGQNIIELSVEQGRDFFTTMKAIISEYNRRIQEVETDLALKIDLK